MKRLAPVLLNDFRMQWDRVRDAALSAVDRVGSSGWLVLGDEVSSFERNLAKYWGVNHCIGCGSGLDAIEIGLRCLGLKRGDEVLTTPLSAFATTLGIVRAGGVPVFVDVDESGQLDLEAAAKALDANRRLRFMLPVHLYGHAFDLSRLADLKDRYELSVVEDCAQAIGAKSDGTPVGSIGDVAATSFYPTKNLGCMGDGGAVLTGSEHFAALARSLRDYGQVAKFDHAHLGMNSRLDELQAAILSDALLPRLDDFAARRRKTAGRYLAEIHHTSLSPLPLPAGSSSAWHLYPVLVSRDREGFRAHLQRRGVQTGVHYPKVIPEQAALESSALKSIGPLTRALALTRQEISLPMHPFLADGEVDRVIEACNSWRA